MTTKELSNTDQAIDELPEHCRLFTMKEHS